MPSLPFPRSDAARRIDAEARGEASHGTSAFYALRARITQALVEQKGFPVVACEADWPDMERIRPTPRTGRGRVGRVDLARRDAGAHAARARTPDFPHPFRRLAD